MDKEYISGLKSFSKELTVLYVEDNQEARESMMELLKIFFNQIVVAYDGEDGLIKFDSNIDLVITDINMPKMNGLDMIVNIKSIEPDIPILVLSAHSEAEYLMGSIKTKVYDYILKPIGIDDFVNAISKIIEEIKNKKDAILSKQHLEIKIIEQNKIIHHQAKLAVMGEMIDSIAHQWKQPLSAISLNMQNLQLMTNIKDNITQEDIDKCANNIDLQINHMQSTMNEFRNFFRPDINFKTVVLHDDIKGILVLLKDMIIQEKINISITGDKELSVNIIPNEFKHIIINIINNAKDAFRSDIKSKQIIIDIAQTKDQTEVSITDNAGGIPSNVIKHIFEPNFTTKTKSEGTGIGLYMSHLIINKINGNIKVENVNDGAKFTIMIPR